MYNFTIFKLRSTIEQMPALVVLKIKKKHHNKGFQGKRQVICRKLVKNLWKQIIISIPGRDWYLVPSGAGRCTTGGCSTGTCPPRAPSAFSR
jgi:hypothetical protein